MMSFTSSVTDAGAKGTKCQKGHVASPFNHLDLRNGMVPLMILFASCDTGSINASHGQESYALHCFNCLEEMNTVVLLIMQ